MKPKPFSALNHFTVPCATCAPTFRATDDPSGSGGRVSALPPVNTNVELEPRGKVQQESPEYRQSTQNRYRVLRGRHPVRSTPGRCSGDEAGLARRLQRWAHAVRGSDDRLQRVE